MEITRNGMGLQLCLALADEEQIGLVEPRWLATGEQTENALKAVRFKTNLPEAKQLLRAGAIQTMTTKAAHRKSKVTVTKGEIPGEATGTTSPQDPNAA